MKVFDYGGIQLIPNKYIVNSRSEYNITVTLGKYTLKMPIVPASMQTIIDGTTAEFSTESGYFRTMHRFDEVVRIPFIKRMRKHELIASISISVKKEEYSFVEKLVEELLNPDYITIDIAHGHADSVIDMVQHIKKYSLETFVIAGNVGTPEAIRELENVGVDATKVGIGPGKVCIIKTKTSLGTGGWRLAALRWCVKTARKSIIADGGIRTYGDIARSVRFDATMVMIGSLFAGHKEPPGETKVENGIMYGEYSGSASEFQKGRKWNVEGKRIWIQHKGSLEDTLVEIQQDLQSSIPYAGGRDLEAIRKADYVIVKSSIFNGGTI